jgi:hypothetical protein
MGALIQKVLLVLYGAGFDHSGSPMLWDDPQFPHGSEPKALKLLQGGTLWEAMMGVIIRETLEALRGALCGTLAVLQLGVQMLPQFHTVSS